MNHQQRALRRKVIYIAAICLLLFPLFALGQPATRKPDGGGSPGGQLAKLRAENDLAQSNLGEIDPASETMKLATLGLRGVAANLLWTKANEYKMKKNWDKLSMTLNQIIKIQPNFMSVWEFQAHNLSYNVSSEFDDYQYRYHWVKKGMTFLMSGIAYNKKDYRILTNLGFFFGTKLGRSDEKYQFRRMFRKDNDFHTELGGYIDLDATNGPGGPDNWLVSHQWYKLSEEMVGTDPDVKVGGKGELMFYKDAPSMLRNYAADLEADFEPDERARRAWANAFEAWKDYGNRQIKTSIETLIVLNDEDRLQQRIAKLRDELDAFVPGVREDLMAQRIAALTPEEYAVYKRVTLSDEEIAEIDNDPTLTPREKRLEKRKRGQLAEWSLNLEERDLALRGRSVIRVADEEVLAQVSDENSEAAHRLFLQLADAIEKLQWVNQYQQQVNFRYWEVRALAESQQNAIDARSALFHARRLEGETILDQYVKTDPVTGLQVIDEETGEPVMEDGARQRYEDAFRLWAEIYQNYPDLIDDIEGGVMIGSVGRYYQVLETLDEDWPLDFPLQFLVDRYADSNESPLPTSEDVELLRLKYENETDDDASSDGSDNSTDENSDDDAADDDAADDDAADDDAADDDNAADDNAADDNATSSGDNTAGDDN